MNVNTGFEIKFEPDKQKSFLLFGQSCFVDVSLIESGLLLALVPKINKIIEWEIIVNLEFANIVHPQKFFDLLFGHILEVKGYKKYVTIHDILFVALIPDFLFFWYGFFLCMLFYSLNIDLKWLLWHRRNIVSSFI